MIPSSPRWRAAGLLVLCLVVFNANLRTISSYDSLAASVLPFNIWWGHGLDLDRLRNLPPDIGYSIIRARTGHWVATYPIVTPLLVTPLYAPLRLLLPGLDGNALTAQACLLTEKLAASLVTALSVVMMYLTLRRIASERLAVGLALVYAFATCTWTISSQALWQHGAAELFLATALYLLVAPQPVGWRAAALGLLCGLMVANRPQDLFLAAGIAAVAVHRSRRAAWPLFVAGGAIAMLLLAYNHHYFGNLVGGYGEIRLASGDRPLDVAHWPDPESLATPLVSNRGLLIFCPFFFALVAVRGSRLAPAAVERWLLAAAVVALLVFLSCFPGVSGGSCYGQRYLTDALPILCIFLADAWERLRRPARVLFVAAALFAVGLQVVGAFCYPAGDTSNDHYGVWSVSTSAPVRAWRHGPASPYYLIYLARTRVSPPLPPAAQQGRVTWLAAPPRRWPAASILPIDVAVTNTSPARWTSLGGHYGRWAVRLLAEWQPVTAAAAPGKVDPAQAAPTMARPGLTAPAAHALGALAAAGALATAVPPAPPLSPIVGDFWLRWRLMPHETVERRLAVTAPDAQGTYRLVVEPGQPTGNEWVRFSNTGLTPAVAIVTVTPPLPKPHW